MSQELNLKNVFRAEQVRLKPYYDMGSYRRELIYAYDVLGIHIGRIEDVLEGKWLPEKANEEFGELVTEIRGLSRTDSTEDETTTPLLRREAVEQFYAGAIGKFDDPKDRMIFIQGIAAIDGGEQLDLLEMYHEDFNAALIEYKERIENE